MELAFKYWCLVNYRHQVKLGAFFALVKHILCYIIREGNGQLAQLARASDLQPGGFTGSNPVSSKSIYNYMGTSKGNYGRKMYSNPEYRKKISDTLKLEKIKIKKECPECGTEFEVERTLNKDGSMRIPKYEKTYCSRSCANGHKYTEEWNKKISKALKIEREPIYCQDCGKELKYNNKSGYCNKCYRKHRYDHLDKNKIHYYRQQCQFDFNLADYPDEFDFSLVEKYGWYKAANRGNNLEGVSRDHMVSISYGFNNNIDPEIIRHPADCQLLMHNENVSKGKNSGIELEELLERIEKWNKKYR